MWATEITAEVQLARWSTSVEGIQRFRLGRLQNLKEVHDRRVLGVRHTHNQNVEQNPVTNRS